MATTTKPSWTRNAAGNIRASATLAASGTANYDRNYDEAIQAIITVKNTPISAVAATRGLRVQIKNRYGSAPTTGATPVQVYTSPSAVVATVEDLTINVGPGQYNILITNLDATNSLTVEITDDTMVMTTV